MGFRNRASGSLADWGPSRIRNGNQTHMSMIMETGRQSLEAKSRPAWASVPVSILAFACWLIASLCGWAAGPDLTEEAPTLDTDALGAALSPYLSDSSLMRTLIGNLGDHRRPHDPPPPQLPEKFRWTGRYVVSDLVDPRTGKMGIEVPFVFYAQDGNVQMIAGGPGEPIFFTNFIYKDHLYTATFQWPGLWW